MVSRALAPHAFDILCPAWGVGARLDFPELALDYQGAVTESLLHAERADAIR